MHACMYLCSLYTRAQDSSCRGVFLRLQGALKAVMRTASSADDSKNGRLDRALMRLDHTLDPARSGPQSLL